ncbi:MAG: family 10 glycosylhydrolase [Chitinophagaceae bacterium]|nr:family 10 glycosylhydrolase [Chitinophagaceae bacterium]
MKMIRLACSLMLAVCAFCSQGFAQQPEFRAAWIATVENIDWPSKKGLSTEEQKREFINILDMHRRNGMNAIVMQIRPVADAFYPNPYEPWSEYLTGKQGQAPSPYYDPLQFMIEETHKRGMEFHAWLNPYRAVFNIARSSVAPNHPTKVHPEWFVDYGDATVVKRYYNPGLPEVQNYLTDIIRDLVKRYDVDGIHFDDYFYPYRIAGKEFPDAKTFQQYGKGMNKDQWRRSNVDSIIVKLHKVIREEKPWVKFGISPFGVWRNKSQDPNGSNTQAGQTNYDDLYADILLWLRKGWIDYVVPQLYWEIGHDKADYTTLIEWWSANSFGRHCYIGLAPYRANSNTAWKDKSQLPRQIQLSRTTPNIQGQVYFSSKSFNNNPNGWNDSLRNNYYKVQVPTPPMPWLPKKPAGK